MYSWALVFNFSTTEIVLSIYHLISDGKRPGISIGEGA